jgi:cell division septal protein FtsQ
MFRFLKRKGSKKRSVLERQAISKGKTKASKLSPLGFSWSIGAKALVIVLVGVIVTTLGLRMLDQLKDVASYVNSIIVLTPKDWHVEVMANDGTPLAENIKRDIYRVAGRTLKSGSAEELRKLAKQTEALGMLDKVRVIRPLPNTVLISADLRRPALLVNTGSKNRFLSLDGTVFGDSADNSGNPFGVSPTVILNGIFEHRPNPSVDDSLRVMTNSDEQRHLLESIEIWQRSSESMLEVKQIQFQKFRGYSIHLSDGTDVVLGLKPFDYKLKKLRGILDNLKRDGIAAARIELDYEGKAFIKERKL